MFKLKKIKFLNDLNVRPKFLSNEKKVPFVLESKPRKSTN